MVQRVGVEINQTVHDDGRRDAHRAEKANTSSTSTRALRINARTALLGVQHRPEIVLLNLTNFNAFLPWTPSIPRTSTSRTDFRQRRDGESRLAIFWALLSAGFAALMAVRANGRRGHRSGPRYLHPDVVIARLGGLATGQKPTLNRPDYRMRSCSETSMSLAWSSSRQVVSTCSVEK